MGLSVVNLDFNWDCQLSIRIIHCQMRFSIKIVNWDCQLPIKIIYWDFQLELSIGIIN